MGNIWIMFCELLGILGVFLGLTKNLKNSFGDLRMFCFICFWAFLILFLENIVVFSNRSLVFVDPARGLCFLGTWECLKKDDA